MKYVICVMRDSAADVYGVPMFMSSKGQAIRSFSDEVNRVDASNQLNKHPEDFELFYIGTYTDDVAEFSIDYPPVSLIRATDCIKKG